MNPPRTPAVRVTEIFHSIQGESSHAGKPCVFVRLTGCSLRCVYCDTKYAFGGGREMTIPEIVDAIAGYDTRLVELTGGEPLEQEGACDLMRALLADGFMVMLETGGAVSIAPVPREVVKIIDVKCPASGEGGTFREENLALAAPHDEFKFVIAGEDDYRWARDFHRERLAGRGFTTLFSPVHGVLDPKELSGWVLRDRLGVRVQLQLHKYIWGANVRGV